jgi:hypothetical protein
VKRLISGALNKSQETERMEKLKMKIAFEKNL